MRKYLLFLGILIVFFYCSDCVYANSINSDVVVGIQERGLPECDEFAVTGNMPYITITGRSANFEKFQNEINLKIEEVITDKIEDGINNRARSMAFSFTHESSGNIVSVIIYTNISLPGHLRHDVNSINFDKKSMQFVNINTILGPNGVKLMNSYLNSLIRTDPSKYNLSFKGINEDHDFYTESEKLILLFDSYEITKGSLETETVEIPLNLIRTYVIRPSGNFLILLPLREVCEYFGFDVIWQDSVTPVVIMRNAFNTEITLNVNDYKKGPLNIKLESPPVLVDGVTYVPITFFDEILSLSYNVGPDSLVTISEITIPVSNQ